MDEIINEVSGDNELPSCTCKDEYSTDFCPVHHPAKAAEKEEAYGDDNSLVVTDIDMQGYGYWQGYIFKCPACGENAIMVNPSMGKSCSNCARKITVKSKTITAKIRSMSDAKKED